LRKIKDKLRPAPIFGGKPKINRPLRLFRSYREKPRDVRLGFSRVKPPCGRRGKRFRQSGKGFMRICVTSANIGAVLQGMAGKA